MRILLTNAALDHPGGSESFSRDLLLGLQGQGHAVCAYTHRLGVVAQTLMRDGIPVVDDLDQVPWTPEIIHGQHHLETMAALLHFPTVPAIYLCHGWEPWPERPPIFPRIHHYAAVDLVTLETMINRDGLAREQVRLVRNRIDRQRFRPRSPLPAVPRRALVFSNYADAGFIALLRSVCAEFAISVDAAGALTGQVWQAPENHLGQYDLVFAKGRSALEALTVGTVVILCDPWCGAGPLVTRANLDHFRQFHFGSERQFPAVSAELVRQAIARYDAADAMHVAERVRRGPDFTATLTEVVELYHAARAAAAVAVTDPRAEGVATSRYLRWLAISSRERMALAAAILYAARDTHLHPQSELDD
ncbi:MAG: hypothetical protein HQL66_11410 [Magnetococcales bacterium]|nr:hypothetical protein [Magnetococcales bacterium]